MTQAHKTPGAILEIHKDMKEGGKHRQLFEDFYGNVLEDEYYEVLREEPYGHLHLRGLETGKIYPGFHDNTFQTVSKEKKKDLQDVVILYREQRLPEK
jgi:hypothetical protein